MKLSEILTLLSEFNNTICGISDSFVRFLHSDQNVRNAPDQANNYIPTQEYPELGSVFLYGVVVGVTNNFRGVVFKMNSDPIRWDFPVPK